MNVRKHVSCKAYMMIPLGYLIQKIHR